MAIFGPKQWVNPFGKKLIFRSFDLLVFIPEKGFFFLLQNIVKTFFLPMCPKKKVGEMAIFGPKPWVNPFAKMSIFLLFELRVFIAQKGVFPLQNIVKNIFLAYIAQQIKIGKMAIFGLKPWVGKMSIFRLFVILFFMAQKSFFSFQNIIKDIFLAYIS